jgi:predicted porin
VQHDCTPIHSISVSARAGTSRRPARLLSRLRACGDASKTNSEETVNNEETASGYDCDGAEDLGGDFKALFALQNGFKSNTGQGTIAGGAFSHFAWVGLSSSRFGALTLGRQLDLAADALRVNSNGSVQYTFYLFHPANLDNLGIIGDSINNSVKYMTPTLYGFTASRCMASTIPVHSPAVS